MINYIINFVFCSALLLVAYHLLLKNKAIYRFNRFYLLGAILFSLIVPLITIERKIEPLPVVQNIRQSFSDHDLLIADMPVIHSPENAGSINYWPAAMIIVYGTVAFLLLIRFVGNITKLRKDITPGSVLKHGNVNLVLSASDIVPHSFFKYIFLNKRHYEQGHIANAVLEHELTHVRQWHSADIVLIELLQVFCWFNPTIILYRKAMQLNHEFLADEAVLLAHNDLKKYQYLLLSQVSGLSHFAYSSPFNYSITKQRFIMMTKRTSLTAAWLSRLSVMPLMVAAFMFFCNKTDASNLTIPKVVTHVQTQKEQDAPHNLARIPSSTDGVSQQFLDEYSDILGKHGIVRGKRYMSPPRFTDEERFRLEKIYFQMSLEQQKQQLVQFMPFSGKPLPKVSPTARQLEQWKTSSEFGIWINGKRTFNTELSKYQPTDFGQVFVSRLTPKAINYPRNKYQVELMTTDYYTMYQAKELARAKNDKHHTAIFYHYIK